jgi:ABC-2 type transport system permease protein
MTSHVVHQLRVEQKVFWRNRESSVFVFIFPILLYVLLASVYGSEIDDLPADEVLLAGLLAYGAANTAFAGLAISLVIRRESGLLKRLRATPLPPPSYLASVALSILVVFALQTVALFAIGKIAFDTPLPDNAASVAMLVVIGVVGFGGLGFAAASLIRSAEGASAVVNVILLPMAFVSGSFGPTRSLPEVLQWVADVLPLKYYVDLAQDVYLDGIHVWSQPGSIAVVLAWGAAGYIVAARRFRWEPRER